MHTNLGKKGKGGNFPIIKTLLKNTKIGNHCCVLTKLNVITLSW